MKIMFFGSDDFAQKNLEMLCKSRHEVAACVTQPDRARDRGMKMVISPIKEYALEKQIPVFQPEDLNDSSFAGELKGFDSDLFVVIA